MYARRRATSHSYHGVVLVAILRSACYQVSPLPIIFHQSDYQTINDPATSLPINVFAPAAQVPPKEWSESFLLSRKDFARPVLDRCDATRLGSRPHRPTPPSPQEFTKHLALKLFTNSYTCIKQGVVGVGWVCVVPIVGHGVAQTLDKRPVSIVAGVRVHRSGLMTKALRELGVGRLL